MSKPKQVDNRIIPEKVLDAAIRAVNDGAQKHGDTTNSFVMIGELWAVYIEHIQAINEDHRIRPHHVAAMMALLKIARGAYSDHGDNFVDTAGYAALGAMLHPDADTMEF